MGAKSTASLPRSVKLLVGFHDLQMANTDDSLVRFEGVSIMIEEMCILYIRI